MIIFILFADAFHSMITHLLCILHDQLIIAKCSFAYKRTLKELQTKIKIKTSTILFMLVFVCFYFLLPWGYKRNVIRIIMSTHSKDVNKTLGWIGRGLIVWQSISIIMSHLVHCMNQPFGLVGYKSHLKNLSLYSSCGLSFTGWADNPCKIIQVTTVHLPDNELGLWSI